MIKFLKGLFKKDHSTIQPTTNRGKRAAKRGGTYEYQCPKKFLGTDGKPDLFLLIKGYSELEEFIAKKNNNKGDK